MKGRLDKAVILAAGRGNRMRAATPGVPKPLLSLDGAPSGPTFLDWHLLALRSAGIREIFIVGSRRTFGTRLRAMTEVPATWILNPTDDTDDLPSSGSAHSWAIAVGGPHAILDGRSRVIMMDADILYGSDLFVRLSHAEGDRSKTLVCPDYLPGDEEVLVFSDEGRAQHPRIHGKGLLSTPLTRGLTCIGEATGVVVWEPGDHELVAAVTDWTMRYSTAKLRSEHEDVTGTMMTLGRMDTLFLPSGFPFMEVDTPEEYERAIALHARLTECGAHCGWPR
jgi:choline kinase